MKICESADPLIAVGLSQVEVQGMGSSMTGGNLFGAGSMIADRYEVQALLGRGSMGTVIRVIDRVLDNETCALKLLHPAQAQDETALGRFRNEVILARRLGHSHIARTFDFGAAGHGYYYLSMEYVPCGSLDRRIVQQQDRPLRYEEKLQLLSEIADGIAYAHDMGVVHRDLKPENVLLTERGSPKITDFGLARSLANEKGFTGTGETVGTPCYMAPEQFRGEKSDGGCDIYSLGIIAFELMSGRKPFYHQNYLALAELHMRSPIPSLAGGPNAIPRKFDDFLRRCTAKRRKDRYATAHEVVKVLRQMM